MSASRQPEPTGAPTAASARIARRWRPTCSALLGRRHRSAARLPAGVRNTPSSWRAPSASRCRRVDRAGQARRHPRPPRPRARDQRRRRHDLRGAVGDRRCREQPSRSSARRSATAPARSARSCAERLQPAARLRLRPAPGVARRRRGASPRSNSTASASSRRAGASIPNKELAAHLLGLRRRRQQRARRPRVDLRLADPRQEGQFSSRPTRAATRSAGSSVRRRAARRSS